MAANEGRIRLVASIAEWLFAAAGRPDVYGAVCMFAERVGPLGKFRAVGDPLWGAI